MPHRGQEVRSRVDYIIGTERHLYQNVVVRETNNKTNNCMVLGCLLGTTLRENQRYLRLRMRLPIYHPKRLSHEEKLFASPRQAVLKTTARERSHTSWISEETW